MSDHRMRIGLFSRSSLLSVKALRAYHEQGVLVPAAVDPDTGYRVYTADQLLDAAVIRELRALDVPLAAIREVVQARDPEVTRKVLDRHLRTMRERLDDTLRIVEQLQIAVDAPLVHTPVEVRREPHRDAWFVDGRASEPEFGSFLDRAYATLSTAAEAAEVELIEPPGALYPPEIADESGESVSAFVVVPVGAMPPGGSGVRPGEIAAATVAFAIHRGSYESIGVTYRQLGAWIAGHTVETGEPVRERYLVSYPQPPDEFVTEILWPIDTDQASAAPRTGATT